MSATNHTVTIGLSQYVSTDKPTYLVDYNSDMLAIDNAIATDRGNITDAKNTATTADGKADANKTSIDSLNVQINGDPEDPTDVGIAGDLNAVEGTVNTVTSLIGNGTPTTSDQTIIGAINNLEGSVAPREDSATLANNYVIGAKFARGGSVYEALASLTAGTAFASLVLNTDYKVADTLVKQIEDAASGSGVIANIVNSVEGSIAPREDGTTLSDSYSQGDQFIRAGVLYEALVSLTAGTTFASLVLNTDYKVADTIVDQIASASELPSGYVLSAIDQTISVTADGTKTYKDLFKELSELMVTTAQALANGECIRPISILNAQEYIPEIVFSRAVTLTNAATTFVSSASNCNFEFGGNAGQIRTVNLSSVSKSDNQSGMCNITSGNFVYNSYGASVPAADTVITIKYDVLKAIG